MFLSTYAHQINLSSLVSNNNQNFRQQANLISSNPQFVPQVVIYIEPVLRLLWLFKNIIEKVLTANVTSFLLQEFLDLCNVLCKELKMVLHIRAPQTKFDQYNYHSTKFYQHRYAQKKLIVKQNRVPYFANRARQSSISTRSSIAFPYAKSIQPW